MEVDWNLHVQLFGILGVGSEGVGGQGGLAVKKDGGSGWGERIREERG